MLARLRPAPQRGESACELVVQVRRIHAPLERGAPASYGPLQPAALGAGLPLFRDLSAPLHLELAEATTYAMGVAIHVYRPRSTPAEQPVDPDQPEQVG